ncbi:hypothetical protein OPQ81_001225 [Rhizoctonia solani]|nr:hypothetical protein OPQ81_001225 [Rhizoctonia solani]
MTLGTPEQYHAIKQWGGGQRITYERAEELHVLMLKSRGQDFVCRQNLGGYHCQNRGNAFASLFSIGWISRYPIPDTKQFGIVILQVSRRSYVRDLRQHRVRLHRFRDIFSIYGNGCLRYLSSPLWIEWRLFHLEEHYIKQGSFMVGDTNDQDPSYLQSGTF